MNILGVLERFSVARNICAGAESTLRIVEIILYGLASELSHLDRMRESLIYLSIGISRQRLQSQFSRLPPNQGVDSGDVFGVPPSIVHEYPNDAGFPIVIISSGVATREYLKPVSSNRPKGGCGALAAAEEKGEGGLSTDKGDTMLSFLI